MGLIMFRLMILKKGMKQSVIHNFLFYPLVIDEIQYAPILMEVIESIVNEKRLKEGSANGLFILTGSQSFSLMRGVSQSLASRATIFTMNPLSYNETIKKEEVPFVPAFELLQKKIEPLSVNELFKMIVRGFYPELFIILKYLQINIIVIMNKMK